MTGMDDMDLLYPMIQTTLTSEEKKKVMKIIKTQNFINGYWGINEQTKFILKDYKKDYELLKKYICRISSVPINL